MSKWFGKIAFATQVEYEPGCWEDQVVKRPYYGDLISNRWKREKTNGVNDNINLSNQISIVADPFALSHISTIIYIEHMGAKWCVTDVDTSQFPRLILTVGGVYNGDTTGPSE